jgi:transglutaminase-like putative cysteine protease
MRVRTELIHYLWAFSGLTLALLPHATRFSAAIIICFTALGSWRLLGHLHVVPLPDKAHGALRVLKLSLAVAACLAVWVSYRGQPGRDAGVALLAVLAGLKLVELNSPRDFYIANALGYFLVVTNFLYSQSLLLAAYLALVVLVLIGGLVAHNAADRALRVPWCAARAGLMLAQAAPIAVAAFLLFPRIEGPLWGRPLDPLEAVSGLSEEMEPGSITTLTLSDEIAFRAAFEGPIPPAHDRYWRGPVLWNTDGRAWRAGDAGEGTSPGLELRGTAYRYTVTLEPNGKRWLFALEMPEDAGVLATRTADLQLRSRYPVRRRISYSLTSHTDYRVTRLSDGERSAALALPPGAHPETRALARRWRRELDGDRAVVNAALSYIRREPFVYTLTPAPLGGDNVDQFLFETREGFCEHFAGSFVTLLRAAGIPARVVTGYQGGEYNPIGDYLIVRQRDAHAWAEVWLGDHGWVRIDPTAAVAPERVSVGLQELISARAGLPSFTDTPATVALWRGLRNSWDAVNYRWNQWVLGYTPARQRQFLGQLGLDEIRPVALSALLLSTVAALLAFLIVFSQLRRPLARAEPARRVYDQFCRRLGRAGLPRAPNEGPLDYAARVIAARSELRASVEHITLAYVSLRYGPGRGNLADFKRLVSAFRPGKARA